MVFSLLLGVGGAVDGGLPLGVDAVELVLVRPPQLGDGELVLGLRRSPFFDVGLDAREGLGVLLAELGGERVVPGAVGGFEQRVVVGGERERRVVGGVERGVRDVHGGLLVAGWVAGPCGG